jgi:hypothetical protein
MLITYVPFQSYKRVWKVSPQESPASTTFVMHSSLVFNISFLLLETVLAGSIPLTDFDASCANLAKNLSISNYPGIKVNFAKSVAGGTALDLEADGVDPSCWQFPRGPIPVDLCRISLEVPTSGEGSRIFMEAWLPKDWNGRFLAVGNGGLNGCKGTYFLFCLTHQRMQISPSILE